MPMDGFLGVAPTVASMLGFSAQRLVGRRFSHRVVVARRTSFQVALSIARATGTFPPFESELRSRTGRPVTVKLTQRKASGAGNGMAMVLSVGP